MINVIIAVDEKDAKMGSYFQMCAADISFELLNAENSIKYKTTIIRTDELTDKNIKEIIKSFNDEHYIFLAYSHGTDDCLGIEGIGEYVDLAVGVAHFYKSVFYTFSCSSAIALGPGLVDSGCHSFWGYNDSAGIIKPYESLFLECTNHGFKCLLTGSSVEEAFALMIDKFDEAIKSIYLKNWMVGAELRHNRDALTIIGNNKLKLADIH